jgi:DNA topoisomerase-1
MQVEKKRKARHAPPPFTTSTLQQAAVRQLGMTTDRVMRTAQQLYEGIDVGSGTVGLITYMRTDSVNLAKEAIEEMREYIGKTFDKDYLPSQPVHYRAKTKNAQEAHEAIRPTGVARTPESLKQFLSHDQMRLYELIWKRALASQMTSAQFDTVAADLMLNQGVFRATGQTLAFAGFLAVYHDDDEDEEEAKLPPLKEGELLPVDRLYGEQHFTQPPPRYTEASLVKALEEFGIGRPSTYASIISTLQDREYAVLDKKRFIPTPIGRLVNGFLTLHFNHYVDYDFTAKLEDKLDDVSNGKRVWTRLLAEFWKEFDDTLAHKQNVERGIPLDEACPKCGAVLNLQASKRGLFIGCSAYPGCDYTRPLHGSDEGPTVLGKYPPSGEDVLLMNGRYGWYVQVGATPEDKKAPKPRRASLPKGLQPETATLEMALKWLSLPREVGHNPKTGLPIVANIGRFGPYLLHDGKFKSIPKDDDVYTIGLERAVEVLEMPATRGRNAAASEKKELGKHPDDGKAVHVQNGRYGWYVSHNKINATLPKDLDPQSVTLLDALPLLAARAEKAAPPKRAPARKATTAKAEPKPEKAKASKKATAKKPAAKAKSTRS